ncbi:MAG: hypothetical protein HC896_15485 [Bacteroidales bacterium]|nr:hypothetical protein [Bacteroidales bacterium]
MGFSNATNSLEDIKAKVAEKRKALEHYIERFGHVADVYAGMASCLAWNTIYDIINNRVITTVDREWNIIRGGYVFLGGTTFLCPKCWALTIKNWPW